MEAEHPQRLAAYQFDGAPGPLCALYGVRDSGRTVVMAQPLADDSAPEVVAAVAGGLTDFCAMTYGGARQACWIPTGGSPSTACGSQTSHGAARGRTSGATRAACIACGWRTACFAVWR